MKTPLLLLLLALPGLFSGCTADDRSTSSAAEPAPLTRSEVRALMKEHVVVVISRSNRVRLNGESVTPAELPARLSTAGKATPGRPVILLMQEGTDRAAEDFVTRHVAASGLGRVEVR